MLTAPLFDSHCHLDFPVYDHDREQVLARAQDAGVAHILVPGVSPDTWARTLAVCARSPLLLPALGLHPAFLAEQGPDAVRRGLGRLGPLLDDSGAVALGECGLDGRLSGPPLPEQIAVLRAQLELARARDLPVLLHCVKAHEPLLALLTELAPLRGVLHAWSGPTHLVGRFAALGLCFSFGGALTWERARRPLQSLRLVPPDRLLIETDGPDQLPGGQSELLSRARQSRRNEPALLPLVAQAARAAGFEPGGVERLLGRQP